MTNNVVINNFSFLKSYFRRGRRHSVNYILFSVTLDNKTWSCDQLADTYKSNVLFRLSDYGKEIDLDVAKWLIDTSGRNLTMWREAYKLYRNVDEMLAFLTVRYVANELFLE